MAAFVMAAHPLLFPSPHSVSSASSPFISLACPSLRFCVRLPFRRSAFFSKSVRFSTVVAAVDTGKVEKLGLELKSLTLEEARRLVDWLQEELGVSASAFASVAAPVAGAVAAEAVPAVEEKTEFDVIVEEVASTARISVIKVIRSLTNLGLKEAKDLIEGLPKLIKAGIGKEDAEEVRRQLEAAGAKCSIK